MRLRGRLTTDGAEDTGRHAGCQESKQLNPYKRLLLVKGAQTPRIRDSCDQASNNSLNHLQLSLPGICVPVNTESCHMPSLRPCRTRTQGPPSLTGPSSNAKLLHAACCGPGETGARRRHRVWTSLCFMKFYDWPDWFAASETSKCMLLTKF